MKKNTNNSIDNKVSVKRKLIPAVAMLATSAAMLSTSTYAWFTMSKEVEVTGINMTATVPKNIQISLGAISYPSDINSLSANGGYLSGHEPAEDTDWSSSADISHYYRFGKMIPASSTNGINIFYTADADGVGKTVKNGATFYQAANGITAYKSGSSDPVSGSDDDDASTKVHRISDGSDKWGTGGDGDIYSKSTSWDDTNDDGYYIDIPVWFRTSSESNVNLAVEASVKPANAQEELYKAARVAIINPEGPTTSKLIGLKDSDGSGLTWSYYNNKTARGSGITYVDNGAVQNAGKYDGTASTDIYSAIEEYTPGELVFTISAPTTSSNYGVSKKMFIRIWLEGEDTACWNKNAGQNFTIDLKFIEATS